MSVSVLQQAFGRFNAGDLAGAARLCAEVLARERGNADALHLQGVIRMVEGGAEDAIAILGRAAALKSGDAAIFENLGLANLAAARHAEAETALRRALALGAGHGLLHMRLGLAVGAQGRHEEAVNLLRKAAAQMPDDPDVQVNLGNALVEAGLFNEAVECYRRVLARHPAHADTRFNLGTAYKRMGRLDDAERSFREVLAQIPGYADAHVGLGLLHAERGAVEEAIACYRVALEHAPAHLSALNNLGNALTGRGDLAAAEALFEQALAAGVSDPDIHINLGNLRVKQGRPADARALYEGAIDSAAGTDALANLGKLGLREGNYAGARAFFQRALERAPGRVDCMTDMAAACRDAGDLTQAEAWFRKALAVLPDDAAISQQLGDVLKLLGRFAEAASHYGRALELDSDCVAALGGLVYVRQQMSEWDGLDRLWARLRENLGKEGSGITPFSILSQPTTPAEQLSCARAWARAETAQIAAHRTTLDFDFSARRGRPARLRVGYLSWDLHEHATAYLIAELFELHDRRNFEIFAYSYGPDDGSPIRARIRGAVDRFTDLARHPHVDAARAIYADRIDILVDLKGYTQGARSQIVALRPAPVQVNWLGYPGSMGMEQMDAIIADPFVIPPGAETGYSERIVRLPDCYQINDRRREIAALTPARAECGLPEQGTVFCCFNQSYKILPDVFASWLRVLDAVPQSVLWLLETNAWAVANLRQAASDGGIAPERLIFAPRRPLAEHLARYRLADLALDTFPYTSHTTASDALWAGCPLVTCAGATFASRVAGSILHAAGLPELVTNSLAECERLTIELAQAPLRLVELRQRLAAGRDSCALFDSPRFVRNLERAYETLWDGRQDFV
jgi:predicted O-linked N-acetylglucosamine transferase (SPINDLY family)